MADQSKKPQAPQKPAPKPGVPTTGSGCGGGAPTQKPANPKPGQK